MNVSFTETYLEDALGILVGCNVQWLDDVKVKLSYAQLKLANAFPDEMSAMQREWQEMFVKNILKDKPSQWIRTLEKLGATAYSAGLGAKMDLVWLKRHSIVHKTQERHMSLKEIRDVLYVIGDFIDITDRFVVNLSRRI